MEIADRDLKIIILKKAIRANNAFVVRKLVHLEKAQRQNELLKIIYNDYKQYYNYMVEEKRKQAAQMKFLVNYLEKSIAEAGLTKAQMTQAKHEQNNILGELDSIRSDLESMIYETPALDNRNEN